MAYSGGETRAVNITAPAGCAWTTAANDSWLSVLTGNSGVGNGTATVRVDNNRTMATRNGTLTLAGRVLPVNQIGTEDFCVYDIAPKLLKNVTAAGGNGMFNVNSSCAWTAVSNDSWLTITSAASGNGRGQVTFTVSPNTNASRRGTITVAGQEFVVKQKPR